MLTARFPARAPRPRPLAQSVDQLVESFLNDWPVFGISTTPFPALNAWEDAHNVSVEAELPGFRIANLNITMTGNELTISGTRPETARTGASFFRSERPTGTFTRTIRVGVELDSAKVQATLVNGVLTITLPKAESVKPRKIDVKVN